MTPVVLCAATLDDGFHRNGCTRWLGIHRFRHIMLCSLYGRSVLEMQLNPNGCTYFG